MKQTIVAITLLVLSFNSSAQYKHEKIWGSKGFDGAFSTASTSDGGYIMTGLTKSQGDTFGDIFVFKLNSQGDTTWTTFYGGADLEGGNGVIETKSGEYLVTGHTESFGAGDCDAYCMKLTKEGKRLWFKTYGGISDDVSVSVVESADSGFVFVGNTANFGAQQRDIYFVKINNIGDTVWTKHYGGAGTEYGYGLKRMPNGGYIAVGMTNSFGAGKEDGYIVRINETGDTLWTKTIGGAGNDRLYDIEYTNDGDYIVAGYMGNSINGKPNGLLVKLNKDGKILWTKTYGTSSYDQMLLGIAVLPDGSFISSGMSKANDTSGNALILTTDSLGLHNSIEYSGPSGAFARSVSAHNSTNYLIAGSTYLWMDNAANVYYAIIDSNATSGINTMNFDAKQPLIFPNPATNETLMQLPEQESKLSSQLQIINYLGQVIQTYKNKSNTEIKIDLVGLPSGIYLYRLLDEVGNNFSGRIIVEK